MAIRKKAVKKKKAPAQRKGKKSWDDGRDRWSWWSPPRKYTTPPTRRRQFLRAVWDLHAFFGDKQPWLWRGQANAGHGLVAGVHSRINALFQSGVQIDDLDQAVRDATVNMLGAAKASELDRQGGVRLTDLPLLARLQHYGAGTPLLDVSLDPLVGLYMAVVSPNPDDHDKAGALFAIKRPKVEIRSFESRDFASVYDEVRTSRKVHFYTAPDVSDRLRIQRGHFLLGSVSLADPRSRVGLRLEANGTAPQDTWLAKRIASIGKRGLPAARTDVAVFGIPAEWKQDLRDWLERRTGLTPEFVYPTPWNEPHLGAFATSHGRRFPWTTP